MRYSQSREKLFSLLDLTEYMMMDLTDATLDQQLCELFTRLYLGGEQCCCGEQMWRVSSTLCQLSASPGLEGLAASHTHPATQGSLMLGCWAAICWRLVVRGHVQVSLHVLLGSSACSRPSTLLATRRCDLVKLAKGGSRFWALLQHPQEDARPSKTYRYNEGCLLDFTIPELVGRYVSGNVEYAR